MIPRGRVIALSSFAVVLIVGGLSVAEMRSQTANARWVTHTHEVIEALDAARTGIVSAESAQNAYVLAEDASALERLRAGAADATQSLERVARLTIDNAEQQRKMPAARAALLACVQLFERITNTRRLEGQPRAAALIESSQTRDVMDAAYVSLERLRDTELRLLKKRAEDASRSALVATVAVLMLIALAATLAVAAFTIVRRQVHALEAANTALGEENRRREQAEAALAERAADLARSNADLEQFAYIASHDLQEPLRMVASYTELLGRRYTGRLDQDADDFIGFAIDGAKRMQALINDLLQYAQLSNDATKDQRPVDLSAVVDDVVRMFDRKIDETAAQIEREPMPTVIGSPTQMRQLFQNLIGNALKFRQPGRAPIVHVGAERRDGIWDLTVRDNGIGIPTAFAERVFGIFQRLHPREAYDGTGIGLTICRRIVERHRGRIWAEPQPDGCTAFHVTLPATLDMS